MQHQTLWKFPTLISWIMDSIAVQLQMTMEAFSVIYIKSACYKDPQIQVSSLLLLQGRQGVTVTIRFL